MQILGPPVNQIRTSDATGLHREHLCTGTAAALTMIPAYYVVLYIQDSCHKVSTWHQGHQPLATFLPPWFPFLTKSTNL